MKRINGKINTNATLRSNIMRFEELHSLIMNEIQHHNVGRLSAVKFLSFLTLLTILSGKEEKCCYNVLSLF